jgi:hypothetical protein
VSRSFRLLWWFDALVAAVVFGFFLLGLGNGTVSSFNAGIWTVMLLVTQGVLWGSRALYRAGQRKLATTLALLLALPGFVCVLFFGVLLLSDTRWN